MGGVGKTTLAKQVAIRAKRDMLFDKIVLNIQGTITDNLGLQFKEETVPGRANRLCNRLKNEEKILLILDNIWGSIDFECADKSSELAKECGGIPVAIVTIAKALKNKREYEWRRALGELKNPSSKSFGGIAKEVYTSIKLSYGYLENEDLKEMFLLCSRMGHTYDASIQELFRYGLGLGLFENFSTVEEALCNVYASVDKLKAASLLLDALKSEGSFHYDTLDNERFAMHDVVSDVAKSIASREQYVFTLIDSVVPRSWTNEDALRNCTSITLQNIGELPEDLQLLCPQLKFLYMKPKEPLTRIVDNFFAQMSRLQVLHLFEMDLWPLRTSLSCLKNLRALCLDECELGDIAIIGDLKKLEILSFCGSRIEKLPEQVRHLTRLRLLDLTDLFSSLTKLEALYIRNAPIEWGVESPNIERSNVSIDELKHLRYLTILEIYIPDAKLSKGLLSPKFERYKIFIGDKLTDFDFSFHSKTSRMVTFNLDTNEDEVISQLKGIRGLELREVPGASNLVDDLDRNGFPELKNLTVMYNPHCLCIVDSKQSVSCDALPSLESLVLWDLYGLEKICNGPLGVKSFLRLRTIEVMNCHKLNHIFSFSTDRVIPQLQEINVFGCENMEEIFAIGGQDEANNSTEVVDEFKFSQLHILKLSFLPQLKSFSGKVKTASPLQLTSDANAREIISEEELDIPTALFNQKVVFPNLQTLDICGLIVENIWHNLLPTSSSWVQNLSELSVSFCSNLKELFPSSMVNSFVQLRYLTILYCDVLEEMIVMKDLREEEGKDTITFPRLNNLKMGGLAKLRKLCSEIYIEFPSLKEFIIENCSELEAFTFNDKIAFPNLETLKIYEINVEKIWDNQLPTMSCYQNLTHLIINGCGHLKELFSSSTVHSFVQLQYLEIGWCPLLEEIVVTKELSEEKRDTISFRQLNLLSIQNLANLRRLCSSNYIEFPSLKFMRIDSCDEMKEFIFDDKVGVPCLEKMEISFMDNLETIWHNQLAGDSFSKLKSLEVRFCQKLLTVFSSNMYGRFLCLESLDVRGCVSLEEIFDLRCRELFSFANLQKLKVSECQSLKTLFSASNVAMEAPARFRFPKLTSLKLDELPNLKTFYTGRHTVEGPILKKLKLYYCVSDEEDQMQQPLFFFEKAFPCLEELRLAGKNVTMMIHGQDPECLFHKLKILQVKSDESTVLPLGIIQRLHNLEMLSLCKSSYKEMFSCGEVQNQEATLAKIKKLDLQELKDLKYIWEQNSKLDLILQNLEVLTVTGCYSLINLMLPSISFQNLTILEVDGCHTLENIVTSSMAKSLVNLVKMSIQDCAKITEVVGNQGEITEEKIIFSNLKSLSLLHLPNLTSFCPWNFILEFPSLKEIDVSLCLNIKIFSRGDLITQRLQKADINGMSVKLCQDADLNKAIREFKKECKIFLDISL
ncbi:hypothetical protein ACOSP7_008766 [Xanthoceras sorbifolium]